MDIIRDSAFFTTLLHCVLAYSLPSDHLAVNPGPHSIVSSIPNSGILQTPSYYDKDFQSLLKTSSFTVLPSWHNPASLNSGFDDKGKNDPPLYTPPGTALKGMGLKYPLTMPRVQLTFVGTSGMLPVNTHEPTDKPQPSNEVPQPAVSDLSTNPGVSNRLVDSIKGFLVKLRKNIQTTSTMPKEYKAELKADKLDNPLTYVPTRVLYQAKLPLNTFQITPSPKPEFPDVYQYPTNLNYPQTIPEIANGKRQEALKPVTSSYKYTFPSVASGRNRNTDYPTIPVLHYGGHVPEREDRYIPYGPNKSKTGTLEHKKGTYLNQDLAYTQHTKSYSDDQPGVLKATSFDYITTEPGVTKDVGMELPPVPTTMSRLRRTQLVLLNTAAGLPGGSTQALAILSAG